MTKEVLDTVTQKTGEMTITSVRDKIATGNYIGSTPGVGYIARKKLPAGGSVNEEKSGCFVVGCAVVASAQQKKAMSIDPFDYSAVMTAVQSIFGTQMNIGTGIQAMMTKRVAQDGRFTVVERRKVNDVMREQDFAASNRVKQGTARGSDRSRART